MRAGLRIPAMLLWLTVLWIALWGNLSWANVVGGILVALGVVTFSRLGAPSLKPTYFRPAWALWYVLVVLWKLVQSNVRLAYEAVRPHIDTHTAIIAVPMRGGSDAVVNLVANSITLTPGTMTIEVKRHDRVRSGASDDPSTTPAGVTLYVHGMFAKDVESVRHDVLVFEALALRAFGSAEDYERSKLDVREHDAVMAARNPVGEETS